MHIVALVADLVFGSKIAATASQVGADVQIVRTPGEALKRLPGARGLIVDLNITSGNALQLLRDLRAGHPRLPVVAFLSHVQVELARQARAAGADEVLPRSKFAAELASIVQRLSGAAA